MAAKNGITPLYAADSKKYTEIVRFLVQHGADKNKSADERATPLKTWQPTTAILGSCSILD
jgi:ankyrin repeat protein